jgi:hypothetical protein
MAPGSLQCVPQPPLNPQSAVLRPSNVSSNTAAGTALAAFNMLLCERCYLCLQGVVDENTLVWGQGLIDWLPMRNVKLLVAQVRTPEGEWNSR